MKKLLLTLVSALLLCTNFNAWAASTVNGGEVYFDATGWNNACIQLMVGHSSYSQGYAMSKINNTNLYYVSAPSWGDASEFAIFGTPSGPWDGEGNNISHRSGYAARYTGIQTNYTLNSGSYYLITSTGSSQITTTHLSSKFSQLNHTQKITIEGAGNTTISTYKLSSKNTTTTSTGTTSTSAVYTATVTCTATAAEGATFEGWYDGDSLLSTDATYTYAAPNAAKTITARFSEVVVATPEITSFVVEPAEITLGESVTFTATKENSENEIIFTVNDEVVTSPWTPDAVGTYTVTATLEGAESKTATVTVNTVPVPVITSFTVSPETITLGESVTFTCEVENGDDTKVVYTIDGTTVTSPWTPGAVGTYTVTATLAGAEEALTATVTVTEAPEEITWTFYYVGSKSNVHAYVWDKGNNDKKYLGEWPGSAMNNGSISFTTTDVLVEPMVIFNDGNGNQTGDLVLENGAYYNDNGVVDTTEVHTVYFINTKGWETVNVYTWSDATGEKYTGDYPGSPATFVSDNIWSYTYIGSDIDGAGVIFNNGNNGEGNQSYDLIWKDNTYYKYEGETTKPVVEEAGFYFVTETNGNWNECLAMTTTDSVTYTYTGPLKGGFKFRLYKNSDMGQWGANDDSDLQIEIGKSYGMKYTESNDAKTFTTPNVNPIKVTIEVNRTLNTVRVLPADVYIAGSAVVEEYTDDAWGVSTIQGCDVDLTNGTYTWTGYLYNNNGDDDARFKFLLGSGFENGGHLIPTDGAIKEINYEQEYALSFVWDVQLGGGTGDQLFHASGIDEMTTYDDAPVEGETRAKVKVTVDLTNMTVTISPVEEEVIEQLFIAGNATEYGEEGRGALELTTGDSGETLYTGIVNFISTEAGFLFPTTETALHPALVAREEGKVVTNFALQGLDYSFASDPIDNQFKVASTGVYKVEVRPDYNSLYLLPYDNTTPADGAYLTVEEKEQTNPMSVTFFEKVSDFDETKVKITPETWWMSYNGKYVEGERAVLKHGISEGTVSFGVNSYDGCLTTGETYTITFEQGAVTFAAKTLETRVNPQFSFTITLAPDTSIGTGIEGVTTDSGIAYNNGVVTAQGTIEVYNVGGVVVARGNDNVDLRGLNGGVYIVRNGNNVRKVVR